METLALVRIGLASKILCVPVAALVAAVPADAGVIDGVKDVDGITVYLGVVPAAVMRSHAPLHTERTMHGGAARRGLHDVHLMVAVFNRSTGERLENLSVTARIRGTGGSQRHGVRRKPWTIPLAPMIVNGALTYGGYTSLGVEQDVRISVDIRRPDRSPQTSVVTAQFEYAHD